MRLVEEEGQKEKIKKEKEENIVKEIRNGALKNCTPKKGFYSFIIVVNIILLLLLLKHV